MRKELELELLHARFGNLRVTENLTKNLTGQPLQTIIAVLTAVEDYMKQIKAAQQAGDTPIEILQELSRLTDEMQQQAVANNLAGPVEDRRNVTCRKGCSFCCHNMVSISELEAKALWDYCIEKGIKIDVDYLKKQKDFNERTHPRSEHSACVFLNKEDKTCNVYELRPLICRTYRVVTPAAWCDVKEVGRRQVQFVALLNEQMVVTALENAGGERRNMATSLLRTRPKK